MKTHSKDYYRILGVPEQATQDQIKKAYRKLALESHPDRNPNNPNSEERFKEITEAYGILMDPLKREEYNRFRENSHSGSRGPQEFRYSQQEIFENMFRKGFGRDVFNDLNADFRQSGFRAGPDFFGTIFFGTAGGLGKFLRMIPGPIGKIGTGLWLLSSVGSSLYTLKKNLSSESSAGPTPSKGRRSLARSLKNIFIKPVKNPAGKDDPHLYYRMGITPGEARSGVQKQISYQVGENSEHLQVTIPPGIGSGQKLRLQGKGGRLKERRGDLILTVHIQS